VPVHGQRYSNVDLEVQDALSSALRDAYTMWVTMPKEPLGMAEVEFEVELKRADRPAGEGAGSRSPGALVGNLRYLRVDAEGPRRWYGLKTPGLGREVAETLIRQALEKAESDALGTIQRKTCSKAEIDENALRVATERPGRSYADVLVRIVSSSVENNTVAFEALNESGTKQTFSNVPWNNDDMVTECPTTLPFEPGQLPAQNAEGTLFLSRELIRELKIAGTPKWPRELPEERLVAPLRIAAKSIIVTGEELADGDLTAVTIDLLDPRLAARDQTLVLDGNSVTVILTQAGFTAAGLVFPVPR
jgi:hypothetical protein